MKHPRIFLLVAGLAGLMPSSASAVIVFHANLTHAQETGVPGTTPPTTNTGDPRPLSYGFATFTLNDAQTELAMTATIYNIDVTGTQTAFTFDNLTAAHIHVGAGPGANAPVRWGFFGAPDNDTNPDNLVVTPFATGVGGTFSSIWNAPEGNAGTTLGSNLPSILAGLSYVNFHTVQFGGGEIRGQILRTPDAGATVWLLGTGLVALLGVARRRNG